MTPAGERLSRERRAGRAAGLRRHRRGAPRATTSPPRTWAPRAGTWPSSRRAPSHVAGLARSRGGSGDPSPFTALGVEAGIRASCERVFGSPSLRGRSVSVIGLGSVGSRAGQALSPGRGLAGRQRRRRDQARAGRRSWRRSGRRPNSRSRARSTWWRRARSVDSSTRTQSRACAAGSSPGRPTTSSPTNGSPSCWPARGILWAPDFVVNAGGIINIAEELGTYDPSRARRHVRAIADTVRQILDHAQGAGLTPLAAAMELARRRLAVRASAVGSQNGRSGRSTPAGRRPSSSSLSRCAASVTAATRAQLGRGVGPGRVEQLIDAASPGR